MNIYFERETIYFSEDGIEMLGYTDYTPELWSIINNSTWTYTKDKSGNPKYIKSSRLNKTLHQVVIDYFFSEEIRTKAYEKDYIIEHLDNNGFNCKISNLYFMKKLTNTYKGWGFDKKSKNAIPIASIKMFHIIDTGRFQISVAFNYPFFNTETKKNLCSVKLLYDKSYDIVFQDAETLLDYILNNMKFDVEELKTLLRFKDIRIEEYEQIYPSEQYKDLQGGNCVMIDGKAHIVQGFDERMRIISIHYDKNWI